MARINIMDLPKDIKISEEETRNVFGGWGLVDGMMWLARHVPNPLDGVYDVYDYATRGSSGGSGTGGGGGGGGTGVPTRRK